MPTPTPTWEKIEPPVVRPKEQEERRGQRRLVGQLASPHPTTKMRQVRWRTHSRRHIHKLLMQRLTLLMLFVRSLLNQPPIAVFPEVNKREFCSTHVVKPILGKSISAMICANAALLARRFKGKINECETYRGKAKGRCEFVDRFTYGFSTLLPSCESELIFIK